MEDGLIPTLDELQQIAAMRVQDASRVCIPLQRGDRYLEVILTKRHYVDAQHRHAYRWVYDGPVDLGEMRGSSAHP